jgi:hypothetical protein
MSSIKLGFLAGLAAMLVAGAVNAQTESGGRERGGKSMPGAAEQLMALANEARAHAGAGRLQWDEALAAAALRHCERMVEEGPIAHRYGGEPDVSGRAGQAGARFDVIEENVAVGPSAAVIHDEWMHSPGHRANLLSPEINRVGIAVASARGVLYAVADYSRGVQKMTPTQVEAQVAELIRSSGVTVRNSPETARQACVMDHGVPATPNGPQVTFVMRWQDSELSELPRTLRERLASRNYHQASVGSCPAQNVEGEFTTYRVAVLLY